MTDDGYPEEHELEAIKNWEPTDPIGLIDYIRDIWAYRPDAFIETWKKNILYLELHTVGWSGNEEIILALHDQEYDWFFSMYHETWHRGGHFYFKIKPMYSGYQTVQQTADHLGMSKQNIHKQKHKFKWLKANTWLVKELKSPDISPD